MKKIIDKSVKNDFKFLRENPDLVYLNSSATSLKLDSLLEKYFDIYSKNELALSRTTNPLGEKNAIEINETFESVAKHLNSPSENIILTYGTTYSINKIAFKLINSLKDGDEIILGKMEHSSNILPWKKIAEELNKKIKFLWYPMTKDFEIDYDELKKIITPKTKIISLAHVYNTVGTKNDLNKVREAVGKNVQIFVDGAQAISHIKIDVKSGDIDYYVFGAHKAFGTFGLGFAYIKDLSILKDPLLYGGGTVQFYSENEIIYKKGRSKFFPGTIDIPGIISFKIALDYIDNFGIENIEKYNNELKEYAEKKLSSIPNVRIINKNVKSHNIFFEINNVAGEDVGYYLGTKNISVRTGSNCVKITNGSYKPYKAIRASFHIYNTKEDIDSLANAIIEGGDFLDALFNKRKDSEYCK